MAHETNLFTTSVTWGGKETLEAFLKPHYLGVDPLNTPGLKLIPNVPGSQKLNLLDVTGKKTKAYATGFSGATGDTYTQKTLTVADMKAEAAFSAYEFRNTVFAEAIKRGYDSNDITDTVLEGLMLEIWMRAVKSDMFRQVWLGDTAKTTVSTYWSATADTNYNAYQGFWDLLMDNAATTAVSASGTHILRVAADTGTAAVAQKTTITITTLASGGTDLVLSVNGVSYTTTYTSSMDATAALFVTNHAADILAKHHITVTNPSGAAIVFTAANPGVAHVIAVASASDVTASGGVVATTANTAKSALTADETKGYLEELYTLCYPELMSLDPSEKVIYMSYKDYNNYLETIEDGGTYTEFAKDVLVNGRPALMYRGVAIIPMNWETHLAADFPANYYTASRIIYTAKDNLVIGLNGKSDTLETEFWYEKKDEQNLMRTRYNIGTQFYSNKLTAVCY